jgi:hypothetical protein
VDGGTQVLAKSLPHLRPSVLEPVLDELMFRRDPAVIAALQALVRQTRNREIARKAIQALATLGGNQTGELLGQIVAEDNLDVAVRRFALAGLGPKLDKAARIYMAKVAARGLSDPLAPDCQRGLGQPG